MPSSLNIRVILLALLIPFLTTTTTAIPTEPIHDIDIDIDQDVDQSDIDPFSNSTRTTVAPLLLLDDFHSKDHNSLGAWHGVSDKLAIHYRHNHLLIAPTNADGKYHIQFAEPACFDLTPYKSAYLHVVFHGSTAFTISLEQNNEQCSEDVNPYPETWDSVEAGRYVFFPAEGQGQGEGENDIYVPLSHFDIDFTRASSVSFHGFYTHEHLRLARVELVEAPPPTFLTPQKVPTAKVVLRCTRPNSFAFGIDDGEPGLAKDVMDILQEEGVKVTFFTVGKGLDDPAAPFGEVYREMLRRGHQVALHSYTHPPMEGLKTIEDIDEELNKNIDSLDRVLHTKSHYFRPPYGTLGARTLQRLYALLGPKATSVSWSVDIEDWLWAGKKPSKQLEAFKRDVNKGGNLVVMHYLHKSTVKYLREGIRIVKKRGMDIMRVDQCLGEEGAPGYVRGWNLTDTEMQGEVEQEGEGQEDGEVRIQGEEDEEVEEDGEVWIQGEDQEDEEAEEGGEVRIQGEVQEDEEEVEEDGEVRIQREDEEQVEEENEMVREQERDVSEEAEDEAVSDDIEEEVDEETHEPIGFYKGTGIERW